MGLLGEKKSYETYGS